MKRWLLLFAFVSACVHPPQPPAPPVPSTVPVACDVHEAPSGAPVADVVCVMDANTVHTNADGYGLLPHVRPGPETLAVSKDGYQDYHGDYPVHGGENFRVDLQPLPPPIPDPPTREQALSVFTHGMQGLYCDTQQFGRLPWWDAAIAWLNADDRQRVYACKHAVGDTHILIALPVGFPLYDEPNQAYSPDRFGPLDWTNGGTGFDARLADLIVEIRQAGFIPVTFPDEHPDPSLRETRLAIQALQTSSYGDLSLQVGFYNAGWDGVFYGPWTRQQLESWPNTLRAICAQCRFGMEFNTGHIPMEAGWDMSGFDALLVEFERGVHNWNNWQIVSRLIGEQNYHRPVDDTSPHPVPRMPMQTPRGEIMTVCFEWKTYWFVRNQETVADVDSDRAYLIAEGCPAIG